MWSRVLSTVIAGALVFFTVAGMAGVSAVSSQPPKLDVTDRPLDIAIQGDGYFRVNLPESQGGGVGYTRCGKLSVNNLGELIVGMGDGLELADPISIPAQTTDIEITPAGAIRTLIAGQTAWRSVGDLHVYHFSYSQNLRPSSVPGVLLAGERSGMPLEDAAGARGATKILQGYLEESPQQ